MILSRAVVLLFLLVPLLPLMAAQTYHVDPAGDDAKPGTAPATAWRTVAKVNAAALQPGDSVLFKRGGTWRESLVVSANGGAGMPITFAAYGTGAKPRLIGSEILANAAFQPVGGGLYTCASANAVNAVLVDDVFLFPPGDKPVAEVPRSYAWKDGTLTINAGGDPRGAKTVWTACVREDVIASNGKSHLVFRDLAVEDSAKANGGYGVRIMGSSDVLLERVEVRRAGKHHFGCINSTGVIHRDCYAAWAMPRQGTGGASAYVSFGDANGAPKQTSEYHGCVFEHTEDTWSLQNGGGDRYFIFITHGPGIGSVLLKDMVCRGGGWSVSNGEAPTASIRIQGGLLEDNRLNVDGTGIVIDGLRITGAAATIDLMGKDHVLQNVVMAGTNIGSQWYQSAIVVRSANTAIRHCTIVMDPAAPDYNSCLASVDAANGLVCSGNILWANGKAVRIWNGGAERFALCDRNLYRAGTRFNDETLAQWQAHDRDVHALAVADPLFVAAATRDFHLQPTSPAVDAADASKAPTTDAEGVARPQGKAPDIGAFEAKKTR